jgi:hypothetical protein
MQGVQIQNTQVRAVPKRSRRADGGIGDELLLEEILEGLACVGRTRGAGRGNG